MVRTTDDGHVIVLFDGICNLCNGAVVFLIRRDKKRIFRYASLQSETGHRLLRFYQLPQNQFESIVVIEHGKVYQRSDAAIVIATHLDAPWSWIRFAKYIPKFLRDWIYDTIARYRYRIFGKQNECMIPGPEYKDLFLS